MRKKRFPDATPQYVSFKVDPEKFCGWMMGSIPGEKKGWEICDSGGENGFNGKKEMCRKCVCDAIGRGELKMEFEGRGHAR